MNEDFKGRIELDVRDSVPDWSPYELKRAPEGTPNVLVILFDDTGMACWSPYGGRVQMPTAQRLADNGLTYTQWHTTALCSPTRSAFLTGRNHTTNRIASIMETTNGFPGNSGRIPDECASIGHILQENGWSTFWVGKDHNVPEEDNAPGGSRSRWPLSMGFDRFYGFLGGETQVGRMIDYLEETGQLENTIVMYCADNGASGEGTASGSVNENKYFNNYPDDIAENLTMLDKLGSADTYNHYPTGWAAAFSTPFQMFKRYAQYAGGTCDPMIISWPKGIKARGEIRHQYHHVTDIVPTILELAGIEMPEVFRGATQEPLPGVSMAYSFDDADAPTRKKRQYYTIGGTRGIWQDGWKAAATHAPLNGKGHFDQDVWELYHVDEDRAEAHNVADQHPEKVEELVKAWFEEAHKYNGLPLDDRSVMEMLTVERPQAEPPRNRYVYYPGTNIPEGVAVNVRGRSYKIVADVVLDEGAEGVLFAHGSRFGGHSLFIKDNKLHYVYNFLGIPPEQTLVSEELTAGPHVLGFEFVRDGAGEHGESVGTGKLYVDDQLVAEAPMRTQIGKFTLCGDGLCIGFDSADTVSRQYANPFPFSGGTLLGVAVDVSEEQYLDLELEAAALLAVE